jgi:tRNA U34 5-carboxymethylaminomethyl modifying enzyme MnmG/GidA
MSAVLASHSRIFASRAEFRLYTRLLNKPSRANSLVDQDLASQAELARLEFHT